MFQPLYRCLLGICILVSFPLVLGAQPTPVGGEIRVNTTTALDQTDPQVAMDAQGSSVVVWTDGDRITPGVDGSSLGIAGQRYDNTGNPVGSEFVVNTDTLGAQHEPAVAMDPDGNFVVVWTDGYSFGGAGDGDLDGIAGQLFDSSGSPVGSQFVVNEVTTGQQTRANVAMNDDGEFLVAWGTFNDSGADLFARRFDSNGSPLGGEFQVNTYTSGRQYRSSLGFDDSGNFVVAWRSQGTEDDIVARRYDADANPLSGEIQVNTSSTGEQRDAGLAVAGGGDFVVVWTSLYIDGESLGIAGRRFDAAGAPVSGEFQVNTYTTLFQNRPDIAMDASGNFVVAWTSFNQDGNASGVFAQQFDRSANPIGSEFQVNSYTAGEQGYSFRSPDIGMDASGNFVVAWTDGYSFSPGQDGDGAGVYAQFYDGNITPPTFRWWATGLSTTPAAPPPPTARTTASTEPSRAVPTGCPVSRPRVPASTAPTPSSGSPTAAPTRRSTSSTP